MSEMDEKEIISQRMQRDGDTEECSVTLTLNEWAAVGSLVYLAIAAGCKASTAQRAYDKILTAQREFYKDEWPDNLLT